MRLPKIIFISSTFASVKSKALASGFLILMTLLSGEGASAASGGGHQFGFNLGFIGSSQEHMNTLITRANSREGGITTSAMNDAYEASLDYRYRFSGSIVALMIRPSYFYQKSTGSGAPGSFDYGLTGFTVFPMTRFYPLENNFLKFFMQLGIGYGRLNGEIQEGSARVEFAGGGFGAQAGLGAEMCVSANHCFTTEGNWRYLNIERNIASSATGTFDSGSISQAEKDKEVEFDGGDLITRMSGLQFVLGYVFKF
jgi:hypothetical protein